MTQNETFDERSKTPCMDCEDRCVGCHSGCERYAEMKRRNALIDKNRRIDRQRWVPVFNVTSRTRRKNNDIR